MKRLLIEQRETSMRAALTENDKLTEIYIDKSSKVGQIIVGRIRTIMPGQFAFIDIGSGKNAFANLKKGHDLKSGQPILVQVQKDASSSKGAYVSCDITLKGWYVILHKQAEVGVSRKIDDEKESRRLKKMVKSILPPGYGAIVRTNAKGCDKGTILQEITELHKMYEEVLDRANYALPPAKLYPKVSHEGILNDIVSEDLAEIHISGTEFTALQDYICNKIPSLTGRIFHHEDKLFESLGIKKQIRAALEKTVPLPCGGFIIIEETEACVAIDINTGNNVNAQSYGETVLATNLNATKVIFDQIILRNLSGIIIIDFIDMEKKADNTALMAALINEARRDRTNPEILEISKLGIVQIARPKRRLSLGKILESNCPHCGGRGRVIG